VNGEVDISPRGEIPVSCRRVGCVESKVELDECIWLTTKELACSRGYNKSISTAPASVPASRNDVPQGRKLSSRARQHLHDGSSLYGLIFRYSKWEIVDELAKRNSIMSGMFWTGRRIVDDLLVSHICHLGTLCERE
jgi:hypothetical protein